MINRILSSPLSFDANGAHAKKEKIRIPKFANPADLLPDLPPAPPADLVPESPPAHPVDLAPLVGDDEDGDDDERLMDVCSTQQGIISSQCRVISEFLKRSKKTRELQEQANQALSCEMDISDSLAADLMDEEVKHSRTKRKLEERTEESCHLQRELKKVRRELALTKRQYRRASLYVQSTMTQMRDEFGSEHAMTDDECEC
jgi:hypothetical protein